MKIYLDDVRFPTESYDYMIYRIGDKRDIYLEDWIIVRNYDDFVYTIERNYENISVVSFDHDLFPDPNQTVKNGLACAKWMNDFYSFKKLELPIIYIHSMNRYGVQYLAEIFPNSYR